MHAGCSFPGQLHIDFMALCKVKLKKGLPTLVSSWSPPLWSPPPPKAG